MLTYKHMFAGLIKGLAFGVVTAMVAGYYGLKSGRTAGAVGWAVRKAVVGRWSVSSWATRRSRSSSSG